MSIWRICTQAALLLVSVGVQAEGGGAKHEAGEAVATAIPTSIEAEHKALHERLRQIMRSGGQTGRAADDVEKLLQAHFVKEEQFALPPLGHLAGLAAGQLPVDSASIIRMTDKLRQELPQMLSEHKKVLAALSRLQAAAEAEGKPEGVRFAKALSAHATEEEQVLYPAALLVGAYLKQAKR